MLKIRFKAGFQNFDKFRVIVNVVIFNIQNNYLLIIYLFRKMLLEQLPVFAFHYKHHVGPIDKFGVHFNAGFSAGTCRPRLVPGMVLKQSFGCWAAPLVLAANEEEVSQ
jgi:hypothetical protein